MQMGGMLLCTGKVRDPVIYFLDPWKPLLSPSLSLGHLLPVPLPQSCGLAQLLLQTGLSAVEQVYKLSLFMPCPPPPQVFVQVGSSRGVVAIQTNSTHSLTSCPNPIFFLEVSEESFFSHSFHKYLSDGFSPPNVRHKARCPKTLPS